MNSSMLALLLLPPFRFDLSFERSGNAGLSGRIKYQLVRL